jgi:hypothetical protein
VSRSRRVRRGADARLRAERSESRAEPFGVDEVLVHRLVDGAFVLLPVQLQRQVEECLDEAGDGDAVLASGVDGLAPVDLDAGAARGSP